MPERVPERVQDAVRVAPYLTHVVRHHGQLTLIPPDNAGRVRKEERRRRRRAEGEGEASGVRAEPVAGARRERERPAPSPVQSRTGSGGRSGRARSQRREPDATAGLLIPDYPPPSFEEAVSSGPRTFYTAPASAVASSLSLSYTTPSSSRAPSPPPQHTLIPPSTQSQPRLARAAPPAIDARGSMQAHASDGGSDSEGSGELIQVEEVAREESAWEADRLAGYSLEQRMERERARQLLAAPPPGSPSTRTSLKPASSRLTLHDFPASSQADLASPSSSRALSNPILPRSTSGSSRAASPPPGSLYSTSSTHTPLTPASSRSTLKSDFPASLQADTATLASPISSRAASPSRTTPTDERVLDITNKPAPSAPRSASTSRSARAASPPPRTTSPAPAPRRSPAEERARLAADRALDTDVDGDIVAPTSPVRTAAPRHAPGRGLMHLLPGFAASGASVSVISPFPSPAEPGSPTGTGAGAHSPPRASFASSQLSLPLHFLGNRPGSPPRRAWRRGSVGEAAGTGAGAVPAPSSPLGAAAHLPVPKEKEREAIESWELLEATPSDVEAVASAPSGPGVHPLKTLGAGMASSVSLGSFASSASPFKRRKPPPPPPITTKPRVSLKGKERAVDRADEVLSPATATSATPTTATSAVTPTTATTPMTATSAGAPPRGRAASMMWARRWHASGTVPEGENTSEATPSDSASVASPTTPAAPAAALPPATVPSTPTTPKSVYNTVPPPPAAPPASIVSEIVKPPPPPPPTRPPVAPLPNKGRPAPGPAPPPVPTPAQTPAQLPTPGPSLASLLTPSPSSSSASPSTPTSAYELFASKKTQTQTRPPPAPPAVQALASKRAPPPPPPPLPPSQQTRRAPPPPVPPRLAPGHARTQSAPMPYARTTTARPSPLSAALAAVVRVPSDPHPEWAPPPQWVPLPPRSASSSSDETVQLRAPRASVPAPARTEPAGLRGAGDGERGSAPDARPESLLELYEHSPPLPAAAFAGRADGDAEMDADADADADVDEVPEDLPPLDGALAAPLVEADERGRRPREGPAARRPLPRPPGGGSTRPLSLPPHIARSASPRARTTAPASSSTSTNNLAAPAPRTLAPPTPTTRVPSAASTAASRPGTPASVPLSNTPAIAPPADEQEQEHEHEMTELDVLLARLDTDAGRAGANYEDLLLVADILGPGAPRAPRPGEGAAKAKLGAVRCTRRRVTKDGRTKLKLALLGESVDRCGICLAQMRDGEAGARGADCGHAFHEKCLRAWLARRATCPMCRTPLEMEE